MRKRDLKVIFFVGFLGVSRTVFAQDARTLELLGTDVIFGQEESCSDWLLVNNDHDDLCRIQPKWNSSKDGSCVGNPKWSERLKENRKRYARLLGVSAGVATDNLLAKAYEKEMIERTANASVDSNSLVYALLHTIAPQYADTSKVPACPSDIFNVGSHKKRRDFLFNYLRHDSRTNQWDLVDTYIARNFEGWKRGGLVR